MDHDKVLGAYIFRTSFWVKPLGGIARMRYETKMGAALGIHSHGLRGSGADRL